MSTTATTVAEETFYTRDEAARIVRLHPRTLTRLAKQGDIEAHRSGNKNLYAARAIEDFLKRRPVAERESAPKPTRNPKYSR